jgi:hypothetical protein
MTTATLTQKDIETYIKAIGEVARKANFPQSLLTKQFPNRPKTPEECFEIAAWLTSQIKLREGALAKLGKATVPVQVGQYPTPAQRVAIEKLMAKKELNPEDAKVLAHALNNCSANANVQAIFNFLRERPWKSNTPAPAAPSQAAPQAMVAGKKSPVGKLGVKVGRYAVVDEGKERLFRVHVTKKGFTKIFVKSSNDWHEIRQFGKVQAIVAAILVDPEAAGMRYGELDRRCRKCGKDLSDVDNPYFNSWLGPDCGENY